MIIFRASLDMETAWLEAELPPEQRLFQVISPTSLGRPVDTEDGRACVEQGIANITQLD